MLQIKQKKEITTEPNFPVELTDKRILSVYSTQIISLLIESKLTAVY